MSEFIEKKIDTYAEFKVANSKQNLFIDDSGILVHCYKEEFDDATLNVAWASVMTGSATGVEANDKYTVDYVAGANTSYIYTKQQLPAIYNILFKFKATLGVQTICALNVGKTSIYVTDDIVYVDTVGTPHYWNSAGSVWSLIPINWISPQQGYIRIERTLTDYKIDYYDLNYNHTGNTAIIAISSVKDSAFDRMILGEPQSNALGYKCEYYFIAGAVNDKKITSIFTNILDVSQVPIIKGRYSDSIDLSNLSDETNPIYYLNANYGLRISANEEMISQGFKLSKDGIIEYLKINAYKNGTITTGKKIWAEIWADNGSGKPSALIEGNVSIKKEANGISTTSQIITFQFQSYKILNKDIQYHIVLRGDYSIDGTNYIFIGFDTAGNYSKGKPYTWNGASWISTTIADTEDLCFGIYLRSNSVLTRFIGYSNNADYVFINDLSVYSISQSPINSVYFYSFGIPPDYPKYYELQNNVGAFPNVPPYVAASLIVVNVDLGKVPTEYCTLSASYHEYESTTVVWEVESSDDDITYSGYSTVSLTTGKCDLTSFGKHRYWHIRINLATTDTNRSPRVYDLTIDHFTKVQDLSERTKLDKYRYSKIEIDFNSNSYMESGRLSYLQTQYRVAYELYIKRVKYKISSGGIIADMELSSI